MSQRSFYASWGCGGGRLVLLSLFLYNRMVVCVLSLFFCSVIFYWWWVECSVVYPPPTHHHTSCPVCISISILYLCAAIIDNVVCPPHPLCHLTLYSLLLSSCALPWPVVSVWTPHVLFPPTWYLLYAGSSVPGCSLVGSRAAGNLCSLSLLFVELGAHYW